MKLKCNVCGGIYQSTLPDGATYFHACPPLSAAEVTAQLQQGKLTLTPDQTAAVDAAAALDVKAPPAPGEPSRASMALAALAVPRPGARNENVCGARGGGKPSDPIAPGIGATQVVDAAPPAGKA
jgi:hypothetical protein